MHASAPLEGFSCHNCGDAIGSGKSLFFMHDKTFCSSSCRLSSAGNGRCETSRTKRTFSCGKRKPTYYQSMDSSFSSREETVSPDLLKQERQQESAVKGGSFFAYVSNLLSSDSFFLSANCRPCAILQNAIESVPDARFSEFVLFTPKSYTFWCESHPKSVNFAVKRHHKSERPPAASSPRSYLPESERF